MADPGTIGQIYADRPHDTWDGTELLELKTPGTGLGTSRAGPSLAIVELANRTGLSGADIKPIFQETPGADTQDDIRFRRDKTDKALVTEYYDGGTWKEISRVKVFVP